MQASFEMQSERKMAIREAAAMIPEFSAILGREKLQVIISAEEWNSMGVQEILLAVYPSRDGQVLKNTQTGEVPCAAVVFSKTKKQGTTVKESGSIRRLHGQFKEVLEEVQCGSYVTDWQETRRIGQDSELLKLV